MDLPSASAMKGEVAVSTKWIEEQLKRVLQDIHSSLKHEPLESVLRERAYKDILEKVLALLVGNSSSFITLFNSLKRWTVYYFRA
jgi:hypothetical protein